MTPQCATCGVGIGDANKSGLCRKCSMLRVRAMGVEASREARKDQARNAEWRALISETRKAQGAEARALKTPHKCVDCGATVARKRQTGRCRPCLNRFVSRNIANRLAKLRRTKKPGANECRFCDAPITRRSETGCCHGCSIERRWKEPEVQHIPVQQKECPIGRYGFEWPRLHGMSDRGIERLMIAAMDKAGINHA